MAVHRNSVEVHMMDCVVLVLSTTLNLGSVTAADFSLIRCVCVLSSFALSRTRCHIVFFNSFNFREREREGEREREASNPHPWHEP